MDYTTIDFQQDQAVGTITLNRPEKRNPLSLLVLKELNALFDELKENSEIKVVIIKAAGKVFSSGHNLTEFLVRDRTNYREIFHACSTVMMRIQDMPQPFIAQVSGIATAAGCQLVAACDLAVAEEGALFSTPGVRIGLFCTTPAIPLVRAIGRKHALDMLLTGRMVTAREAESYGLINRVVPADKLEEETTALAQEIARASRATLSIGKRAFYAQVNMPESKAYAFGSTVMVDNLFTEDALEGIDAFLAKREPVWKDR
jgi:enoyl-CoA hydratase/carnithine racemase